MNYLNLSRLTKVGVMVATLGLTFTSCAHLQYAQPKQEYINSELLKKTYGFMKLPEN